MEQRQFMAPRAEGELRPFGPGSASSLEELTNPVHGGDRAINSQVIAACPNRTGRFELCGMHHTQLAPFLTLQSIVVECYINVLNPAPISSVPRMIIDLSVTLTRSPLQGHDRNPSDSEAIVRQVKFFN